MYPWKIVGRKVDSIYWQAKKLFWRTIWRLRDLILLDPLDTRMLPYSEMRSMADGEIISKMFLTSH